LLLIKIATSQFAFSNWEVEFFSCFLKSFSLSKFGADLHAK
jgi:hypothetical protein